MVTHTSYVTRVIGEEKTLSIKFGTEVNDPQSEDVILIRGASAEVDRAVKEIHQIVEDAKNDLILSGYVSCLSCPPRATAADHFFAVRRFRDRP